VESLLATLGNEVVHSEVSGRGSATSRDEFAKLRETASGAADPDDASVDLKT